MFLLLCRLNNFKALEKQKTILILKFWRDKKLSIMVNLKVAYLKFCLIDHFFCRESQAWFAEG